MGRLRKGNLGCCAEVHLEIDQAVRLLGDFAYRFFAVLKIECARVAPIFALASLSTVGFARQTGPPCGTCHTDFPRAYAVRPPVQAARRYGRRRPIPHDAIPAFPTANESQSAVAKMRAYANGGGAAWAGDKYTVVGNGFGFEGLDTRPGWTVGAGVEWAFSCNWSARLEYDYCQ
jgi:hypothetical protein